MQEFRSCKHLIMTIIILFVLLITVLSFWLYRELQFEATMDALLSNGKIGNCKQEYLK